mmetsp:Transcript_11951/g.36797  ORF Transcript_11951/g.36797 Transcript_11951/m.36797 type:complete len:136 (-) Transcript_11951:122-529(-)
MLKANPLKAEQQRGSRGPVSCDVASVSERAQQGCRALATTPSGVGTRLSEPPSMVRPPLSPSTFCAFSLPFQLTHAQPDPLLSARSPARARRSSPCFYRRVTLLEDCLSRGTFASLVRHTRLLQPSCAQLSRSSW